MSEKPPIIPIDEQGVAPNPVTPIMAPYGVSLMPQMSRALGGYDRAESLYYKDGYEHTIQSIDKAYKLIADWANAPEEGRSKDERGGITDALLASTLLDTAREFTLSQRQGLLTSYTVRSRDINEPSYHNQKAGDKPWDSLRTPITLDMAGTEALLKDTEEVRIKALAEVLDPYRYRHDQDADPAELAAQTAEQDEALAVLTSLEPSQQRDLMAAQALRHFMHPHIARPDLAEKAIQLVSVAGLQVALAEAMQTAEAPTPEAIVARVAAQSEQVLEAIPVQLSEGQKVALQQQAAEAADDDKFRITINMPLGTLEAALFDTFRLLPVSETKRSGGNSGEDGYGREKAESELGILDHHEKIVERPIYGALAVTDREHVFGARNAEGYGNCVITIKPSVATQRTVFTYGDSMNIRMLWSYTAETRSRQLMTLPQAEVAKMYYDTERPRPEAGTWSDPSLGYVEAQILGGVGVEDIESVTIPFSAATGHAGIIRLVRERYPSLPLRMSATKEEIEQLGEDQVKGLADIGVEVIEV